MYHLVAGITPPKASLMPFMVLFLSFKLFTFAALAPPRNFRTL
jgi:hypothetical protein